MTNLDNPIIYVYSLSSLITQESLKDIVEATQIQADQHFKPIWGQTFTLKIVKSAIDVPMGGWRIILQDTIDLEGANGYHWIDEKGIPIAFVKIQGNDNVGTTFSHEALEMLVNPFIDKIAKAKKIIGIEGENVDYLVEVADVTYSDYGYEITVSSGRKVKVTDFYYPAFFYGTGLDKNAKYSYTGIVKAPRELVDGGFLSFTDVRGEIWKAVKAEGKVRVFKASEMIGVEPDTLVYGVVGFAVLVFVLIVYLIFRKKKNYEED